MGRACHVSGTSLGPYWIFTTSHLQNSHSVDKEMETLEKVRHVPTAIYLKEAKLKSEPETIYVPLISVLFLL